MRCGRIDHAGECLDVDFYAWQRFGRHPDPPPPIPPTSDEAGGLNEAPPLSPHTDISPQFAIPIFTEEPLVELQVVKSRKPRVMKKPHGTLGVTSGRTVPVDDPGLAERRKVIRAEKEAARRYKNKWNREHGVVKGLRRRWGE